MFVSLLPIAAYSQGESNVWYFGYNCGLDFNTTPPTALLDGELSTDEGCASICDASGKLLFYSNGETIWNREHQIMQNGNGLCGHFSTSQSATIVPIPYSETQYYIFTIAGQVGTWTGKEGLFYSIIDMALDDGKGAVTEKNVRLADYVTEKQCVLRHENGRDIWLVSHRFDSDEFLSFLVSCTGISEPVISRVGSIHKENTVCCETSSAIGCMKASPDNKRLATAWWEVDSIDQTGGAATSCKLEIFSFDNESGLVFDPISIKKRGRNYGVCFSPNSNILYLSHTYFGSNILQYDLTSADIPSTEIEIDKRFIRVFASIEIGPDNKIYIPGTNGTKHLSVIHNPNILGFACDFEDEAVYLDDRTTTWGLPNRLYDHTFKPYENFLPPDTIHCKEEALVLNMDTLEMDRYTWSNGNMSAETEVQNEGLLWLEIEKENCGTGRDTMYVQLKDCICQVFMPNAFSPNGDNINDIFTVQENGCVFIDYSLQVYNRWGALVHSSSDSNLGWNGNIGKKKGASAVYVYILEYSLENGAESERIIGDVTLVR